MVHVRTVVGDGAPPVLRKQLVAVSVEHARWEVAVLSGLGLASIIPPLVWYYVVTSLGKLDVTVEGA